MAFDNSGCSVRHTVIVIGERCSLGIGKVTCVKAVAFDPHMPCDKSSQAELMVRCISRQSSGFRSRALRSSSIACHPSSDLAKHSARSQQASLCIFESQHLGLRANVWGRTAGRCHQSAIAASWTHSATRHPHGSQTARNEKKQQTKPSGHTTTAE